MKRNSGSTSSRVLSKPEKCLKKFLKFFPKGYLDPKYLAWERDYKWNAHLMWDELLNKAQFQKLLKAKKFSEISLSAARIESKTNLLFSFEKMALRDAVKSKEGAELFAEGLFNFIYGKASDQRRFESFTKVLESLPRKQTRVLNWPLQTVFGFIADPQKHIFVKPNVTKRAAIEFGFDLVYQSRPNWDTYQQILQFAEEVRIHTAHVHPSDLIDLQSFLWVMGSSEYD